MELKNNIHLRISDWYWRNILTWAGNLRGFTWPQMLWLERGLGKISEEDEKGINFQLKDDEERYLSSKELLRTYLRTEFRQSVLILDEIDEDTVFYDVGGFHGYHTILGTLGEKVYTFEPDPENLEVLKENIDLNSEQEIELIEKPLWSEETNLKMHSGLEGKSTIDAEGNIEQKTTTVDNMVELGASAPDVIKIDVEGAEYQVLKGTEEILEKHRPIIVLEAHIGERLQELGGSMEKIESLLEENDYNIEKKQRSGEIHVYAKPK